MCAYSYTYSHVHTQKSCIVMYIETMESSNNSERKHQVPCRYIQRNVNHIQGSGKTSLVTSVDKVKARKGKGKALKRRKIIWCIK